jgi:hypothetical protein
VSLPQLDCDGLKHNGVSMVNGAYIGEDSEALALGVLFSINVLAGLEPTNPSSNCASHFPDLGDCQYMDGFPLDDQPCGRATSNQVTVLTSSLGCP